MNLRRPAIDAPIRTAVGKFGGSLASLNAGALGAIILKALMERTKIDPAKVDDVVFSQGDGNGEAPAIGHWSWLAAGLPLDVPGYQLDRRCGSGLQAVVNAAMMVQTGMSDVVVAGGVESMSNVEYYTIEGRRGTRGGGMMLHDRLTRGRIMSQPIERFGVITGMIETAENLARDYQIGREACDACAVRSHQRAAAAWKKGLFDDELVQVPVPQRKGAPVMFAHDEGYRADASMETLGALKPIEAKIPGAVVTAGNASQQNDVAAACLVVAEDKLEELDLEAIAWFHGWSAAGCDPSRMGIGPVPAVGAPVRAQRLVLEGYRSCRAE
jgi:acetyl-CoA C-acetyltransferase